MEAAIKAAGVKALRLLFVFAASVPERVAAAGLTTERAALPVVKSIGLFGLVLFVALSSVRNHSFGGFASKHDDCVRVIVSKGIE